MPQNKRYTHKELFFRFIFFSLVLAVTFVAVIAAMRFGTYFRSFRIQNEQLLPSFEALKVLHTTIDIPRSGDWLWDHFEPGQSFTEYKESNPVQPSEELTTIYVLPIGEQLQPHNREITASVVDYLSRFFCLPAIALDPISSDVIPEHARRLNPYSGQLQFLTSYIIDELLVPARPSDAVAYIALSETDLWPGRSWNFVFGQATLRERVGVWSIHRFGDASASEQEYKLVLLRAIKTAAHELGHVFGIRHCISFQCLMNGSNHLAESDSKPTALCPNCLQKLLWNTACDPLMRYQQLSAFYKQHGLYEQQDFAKRSIHILQSAGR